MENIFQIVLISIIQGVTEFVPVSSSAHIILVSKFFNIDDIELVINFSAHFGSLVAVVFFFREEILKFSKNKNLFAKIILSSIPILIIGFVLSKYELIYQLRTLEIIGWMTIIFGFLLYYSDRFKINNDIKNNYTLQSALKIGIFQIMVLP